MTISYATIPGNKVVPGTSFGMRGKVQAWPLTTGNKLTWLSENVETVGPVEAEVDAVGDFSLPIPLGSDQDATLYWEFLFLPDVRYPGVQKVEIDGVKQVTASGPYSDIAYADTTAVSPDLVDDLAALVADAEAAALAAIAVGSTNDTIIASRLNDETSATAQAVATLNIKANGATGNGTTDDAAAIQSAMDTAVMYGLTLVGQGDYKIGAAGIDAPAGLKADLRGARFFNTVSNFTMIRADDNVYIKGLELEGPGNASTNSSSRAISQIGTVGAYKTGLVLEDVYIHGFKYYGIYQNFAEKARIVDPRIEHIGYAAYMGISVTNIWIGKPKIDDVSPGTTQCYGIIFTRDGTDGVSDLAANPRSKDCTVWDPDIKNVTLWDAVNCHAGENIKVIDGNIRDCARAVAFVGAHDIFAPIGCSAKGTRAYNTTLEPYLVVGAENTLGSPYEYAESCEFDVYAEDCGDDTSNTGNVLAYVTRNLKVALKALRPARAGVALYNTNVAVNVKADILDAHSASLSTAPGIHIISQYNTGRLEGTFLRFATGLDTFVMTRGIRAETQTNNDFDIGPCFGNASVMFSGLQGFRLPAGQLSNTASLDFPSIAAGGQQDLTITVTGAATGDTVLLGPPSSLLAGLTVWGRVSAANTVSIRLSNITGSAIDPAAATWRATVIKPPA